MPRLKTRYYPDYGPDLLTSGPDWVWQRAEFLVANGFKASQGRDGPDIIRAMHFLRARNWQLRGRWRTHPEDDPEIYEAVAMSNSSPHRLLEIHCRVLAGESFGKIGVEMGVSRSVLRTYLKTFFDVAHRLDQRGYILHRVIKVTHNIPPSSDQLAMLAAFNHGPEAVPLWMDWLENMEEFHDVETAVGRCREGIDLLVETHRLELTQKQALRLAKIEAQIGDFQPNTYLTKSPHQIIAKNTNYWLNQLDFEDSEVSSKESKPASRCDKREDRKAPKDRQEKNGVSSPQIA